VILSSLRWTCLAPAAARRQNGQILRIWKASFRSAVAAALVTALTVLGLAVAPAGARAEGVRSEPWQLGALNAVAAWQYATGAGVVVAVLDSGVDASHPDLAGQVLPGLDLVDGSSDGRVDPVGHGTSVAALIAGRRDESGVVGVAPDARILPVRVLDRSNAYQDASVVARGLRWAVDNGAHVVNLSLGGVAHSQTLADALAYAAEHDVVVVACTGNVAPSSSDRDVWFPAREPGVVAVTGLRGPATITNPNTGWLEWPSGSAGGPDALWAGSLTGRQTVLSAPAMNLLGARPGGYWRVQGTSFATPLVTGTATLVRSRFPRLTAANVINRMIRTANDLGDVGRDDRYGYGQVNPLGAVTAELDVVARNPLVDVDESSEISGGSAGGIPAGGSGDGARPDSGGTENAAGSGGPTGTVLPGEPAHPRQAAGAIGLAATAPSLLLFGFLLAAAAGSFLTDHRHLRRYLRRGRHAR